MSALRERFVALLSKKPKSVIDLPAVIPDELGRGVLRWGSPNGTGHKLFHVRDKAIVAWVVNTSHPGRPRNPLSKKQIDQYTAFLSGVTAAELATTSSARPLVYVARKVVAPFDGFAIVHPSLAQYVPDDGGAFAGKVTWVAFPCYACEIPEAGDADWARLQYRDIGWATLDREPAAAVRLGKLTPPSKNGKPRKHSRTPMRPRNLGALSSGFDIREDSNELENWRGDVLRIEGGNATGPTGTVRITGRAHFESLLGAFVRKGELPGTTKAKVDRISVKNAWDLLEATCGEAVKGVVPVFLEERTTGTDLARMWVKQQKRTLDIAYEIDDPRITIPVLDVAIAECFLRVFTDHYYRGKVDVLRVYPKGAAAKARTRPYPG